MGNRDRKSGVREQSSKERSRKEGVLGSQISHGHNSLHDELSTQGKGKPEGNKAIIAENKYKQLTSEASGGKKVSIFLKKKIELAVSLLPRSLRDTEEAVQDSVTSLLLKYFDGVGGILMAYENIRIENERKGRILDDLPHIHYSVSCDVLVFRPQVGCELHGIVNECFQSHLGIVVFNYFNAMVSADDLHSSGYTFDSELQKWVGEEDSQTLAVNDEVKFKVKKLHECEGAISLEGVDPSLSLLVER